MVLNLEAAVAARPGLGSPSAGWADYLQAPPEAPGFSVRAGLMWLTRVCRDLPQITVVQGHLYAPLGCLTPDSFLEALY